MKLSIEMEDGTIYEAKASDRTWQCLADRVRFQKRFGVNPVVLQAWREMDAEEGDDSTVLSRVSDEALHYMQEEHFLFFVHAELNRRVDGGLPSFDEMLESVIDCEIDASDQAEIDANPSS